MISFEFQQSAIDELKRLAESRRKSVLIEGGPGCGKSYLARVYGELVGVSDIVRVDPTVQSIRACIDHLCSINNEVVIYIENLDLGAVASSYTLLKFLEEPPEYAFVVVTCRNKYSVPDTIVSRSACVTVSHPTESDLLIYASNKDVQRLALLRSGSAWKAIKDFNTLDYLMDISKDKLEYLMSLTSLKFKEPVSDTVWKLGHFPDNSETNLDVVVELIISDCPADLKKHALECARALQIGRVAKHIAVTKFVMEGKYGV